MRRWEYESRQSLEKLLHYYIDRAASAPVDKDTLKKQLGEELDLFRIVRVKYRHEIIFRGNNNIKIPNHND